MGFLGPVLARPGQARLATAVEALSPAAIACFHPLLTRAAGAAARRCPHPPPVMTVVTDLASVHAAWLGGNPDRCLVPPGCSPGLGPPAPANGRFVVGPGLPVAAALGPEPLSGPERQLLRRSLGLRPGSFVVVVTGGAEGSGGLSGRVKALVASGLERLEVVAICGRNQNLRARLENWGRRSGPARLRALGFVDNMWDWLRAADVVATKAGPGTLSETACAGTAMVITSRLPGQEDGNAELFVRAGAARWAPRAADLVREISFLQRHGNALRAMQLASASLGRPAAAHAVAEVLAGLAPAAGGTSAPAVAVVPA
jgi:1,2-diacylglycerol 3-beta-galactosyltransferase